MSESITIAGMTFRGPSEKDLELISQKKCLEVFIRSRVPAEYQSAMMEGNQEQSFLDSLKKSQEEGRKSRVVILTGPAGCGKTHTCWALHNKSLKEKIALIPDEETEDGMITKWEWKREKEHLHSNFKILSWPSLFPQGGFPDPEEIKYYKTWYKSLVMDEVGLFDCGEVEKRALYDVLNYRISNDLWTIITTNRTYKELLGRYEQGCVSRMTSGTIIKMDGKDYRTGK